MRKRIHILGASGSGTTTLGAAISKGLEYRHFDSDSYYWSPASEPFTVKRNREERLSLLKNDLASTASWLLSGSLVGWGDCLIPQFDLVIFVYVPRELRLARLYKREFVRYGAAMLEGGVLYEKSKKFLDWCEAYDSEPETSRSLFRHEQWLETIECAVLRIENIDFDKSMAAILKAVYNEKI